MLGSLTAVLTLLAVALYLLPLVVALARRTPDVGSVAVVNILLGWTLVGWVLALALAMRSGRPDSRNPTDLRLLPPQPRPPVGWPGSPGPPPPPGSPTQGRRPCPEDPEDQG